MAGLDPATHPGRPAGMPSRFVFVATYMVANRRNGAIYLGSTNDLSRRVWEHREGVFPGFSAEHGCKLLVWHQQHDLMTSAIQQERTMKHWPRRWKVELIERDNPDWVDLYNLLNN